MWEIQDEELDEDDPTRAQPDEGEDVAEVDLDGNPVSVPPEGPVPLFNPDGSVHWERGFADAASALRVWADPEGNLVRVRLSPHWRERVSKADSPAHRASGLQTAFTQVFAVLNAVLDDADEQQGPADVEPTEVDPQGLRMSWDNFNSLTEQIEQVHDQLGSLPADEGHGRWLGDGASGEGAEGAVVVTLDHRRRYAGVRFDPRWLEASRINDVARAVMEASREAHARVAPAQYEPGLRETLTQRATHLRHELSAMMQRGFDE